MESDTCLHGIIQPSPESCEERVKSLKSKSDSDLEPELDWVKEEEEEERKVMAVYKERSRHLTSFDAIDPPQGLCGGIFPIYITDDVRPRLITFSKLALDKYNADQGANFVFDDLVRSTRQCVPRF